MKTHRTVIKNPSPELIAMIESELQLKKERREENIRRYKAGEFDKYLKKCP